MKKFTLILVSLFVLIISCQNTTNTTFKETEQSDNQEIRGDLIIFHAGSLSVPFKQMKAEFNKLYPKVNVLLEAAGSVACARKITELNKECDIMASADYKVITNMLIPQYADWNLQFATNEMSLVYNDKSKYAQEINAGNWYKILLKDDVAYGHSDPNLDPCGYRAELCMQLSEKFYQKEGLAAQILNKKNKQIRPKETDLLALLESNTIDYIFLYRSVAEQHHLNFLELPENINLKNSELKDFYAQAQVEITGKTPNSKQTVVGLPMVYGITGIKNAPNKAARDAFLEFVLSEAGQKIMNQNGQPSIAPAETDNCDKLPENLKEFVIQ